MLSGARGEFELLSEKVETAGGWLWAVAQGHQFGKAALDGAWGAEGIVIELEPGATIDGIVLDELGSPVAAARVTANLEENRADWPLHPLRLHPGTNPGNFATSDAYGHFSVGGLDPASEYELRVALDGWEQTYDGYPPIERAGARGVELRIVPTIALDVRVEDAAGMPFVGPYRLEVMHSPGLELCGPALSYGEPVPVAGARALSRFRYHVTRGRDVAQEPRARIQIHAPGHLDYSASVPLELGKTVAHVAVLKTTSDVDVRPTTVNARFRGGRPYSGRLSVLVGRRGMLVCEQVFDFAAGSASSALMLPPGEYTVRPGGWGIQGQWWPVAGASSKCVVEDGGPAGTLMLELAGAPVALDVASDAGVPMRGYDLQLKSAGSDTAGGYSPYWDLQLAEEQARISTIAPATDRWLWLPPGLHTLTVNVPGFGRGSAQVRVPEDGGATTASVAVVKGSWIDLRKRARPAPAGR